MNPSRIDISLLRQYPSFMEFRNSRGTEDQLEDKSDERVGTSETPEEVLESAYLSLRKTLAQEVLDRVIKLDPTHFERLVVDLLVKMGYGGSIKDAGRAIGRSGDEGIDGTIKEDKLGLDIIYLQAKRWQPGIVVGRPELQKFVGALAGQGAKKGVFITTSSFTKDAIEYSPKNETKIVLIDGQQLAQLMIDYNLGVALQQIYEVKKLDNDYFGDV
jgi:restriction system protein